MTTRERIETIMGPCPMINSAEVWWKEKIDLLVAFAQEEYERGYDVGERDQALNQKEIK